MTMETFAAGWNGAKWNMDRRDFLIKPATHGLLAYCRALMRGESGLPSREDLLQVFSKGYERERNIAEALLECAEASKQLHWPTSTLTTETLTRIRNKYFSDDPPHLPLAFFRDVIRKPPDQEPPQRAVIFPLVWEEQNRDPQGKLVRFVLELLDGPGQVFLDPRQAFLNLDPSFRSIFRHAPEALANHLGCSATGDVRVHLIGFDTDEMWDARLQGPSAGGALLLGLWSLWSKTLLQAGVVPSFALTPKGTATDSASHPIPDGNCHPVGGLPAKAHEIAQKLKGKGVFLVADAQKTDTLEGLAQHVRLQVEGGKTLQDALHAASGLLGEVLAYLDALVAEANRVPPYYPRDARMDRVRVRVRVSSERQRFDRALAEERERNRLLGMADEEAFTAYKHRHDPDNPRADEREERRDQPRVEILDWDAQVHDKVRLGVVVGDPGLGKTWLMKWEAARHAEVARTSLRQTGDLSAVTIPIYRRLADVAAALHTLEKRREHGQDDLPTLPDAVIESLRTWQRTARDAGPSHALSEQTLAFLRGRLGEEKALLLLDAFDEVSDARLEPSDPRSPSLRDKILDALKAWVPANEKARVLFTSRVVGYQRPWTIPERSETEREMELLPFDDTQMGAFADAFFASDAAAATELRELLRRTPQLRGMAQIPLLLGFLCALYLEDRRHGQRRDWNLTRRTDLYEAVLQRLLSGRWKEPPRPIAEGEVEAKREMLEPVAYHLFVSGKEQFKLRDVRSAYRSAHAALYPGAWLTDEDVTRRIDEWREQDGILVKAGDGDDVPYLFLHLTFQEYLTACYLAERINKHGGWDKATVPVGGGGTSRRSCSWTARPGCRPGRR